ncbi:hypothetical protein C8Q76DRAFT_695692 [Earliella scabrosa]|nr:hypothetical protein C8Q76DRAFT_695692 [Earliella scabrosa]
MSIAKRPQDNPVTLAERQRLSPTLVPHTVYYKVLIHLPHLTSSNAMAKCGWLQCPLHPIPVSNCDTCRQKKQGTLHAIQALISPKTTPPAQGSQPRTQQGHGHGTTNPVASARYTGQPPSGHPQPSNRTTPAPPLPLPLVRGPTQIWSHVPVADTPQPRQTGEGSSSRSGGQSELLNWPRQVWSHNPVADTPQPRQTEQGSSSKSDKQKKKAKQDNSTGRRRD